MTEEKKAKISFPDDKKFLMIRQSLTDICFGLRSAGKLLSVLLGWYIHDKKTTPDQESFTIQLTQKQIIDDLCGELNAKTLHDAAVPALYALGYVETQISTYVHTYTIDLTRVRQALALVKSPKQLEKVLINRIDQQIEKLLIVVPETIRESSNYNKRKFQLLLEKSLIVIGETSNSHRGRKPRREAASDTQNRSPYTIETNRDLEETFLGDASESPNDTSSQSEAEEKSNQPAISYSQGSEQLPSMSWLQENECEQQETTQPSSQEVEATQPETLFPEMEAEVTKPTEPEKPAPPAASTRQYNIPANLSLKPDEPVVRPPTAKEIEAEEREKARQAKKREVEVYALFDKLFGSPVSRYGYNKKQVEELSKNVLATDAVIAEAFNSVANSERTKKDPTNLTITNIGNVIPGFIRSAQIKVVSQPPSIDKQIEASYQAAKQFDIDQAARRQARLERERMAVGQ